MATSRLVYTPAIEDDGRYLTCRVLAGGRVKESLEDTWEIKVLCEYQCRKGVHKISRKKYSKKAFSMLKVLNISAYRF